MTNRTNEYLQKEQVVVDNYMDMMKNVSVSVQKFNKEVYWKEFVEYAFRKSGNQDFLNANFSVAPTADRNWYALRVGSAKLHIELSFNTQKSLFEQHY